MTEKLECTCIEAYKTRKMRDPNCCACSCDHNDLVEQLAKANERVEELEKKLAPDMFWNSDGDMSFDSLEELFDYYGDCNESGELIMDCRVAVALPDESYKGVYYTENNEWVITEQLRKEQK